MGIRLILLDMDGTLLGNGQVAVTKRNMDALRAAMRQGVEVAPCTGRVVDMLPPQILTEPGIRYVVSCHGARVYDMVEQKTIYSNTLTPAQSAQALSLIEGKGIYAEVAANHTIYMEEAVVTPLNTNMAPLHHLWYMRDGRYTAVARPSQHFADMGIGVEKVNIYGLPEPLQQPLYDELGSLGFLRHTRPGAGADLEFSALSLDKLAATDALLAHLGIGYDEVLAIGDSSSDVAIIQRSAIGVAMGNAPDAIKGVADAVTSVNSADGVACALERFVLAEGRA